MAVTSYGYDVQDHLASVLDAEGNETTYTTGDRDLLTDEASPVSGTTTHAYNEHGELITTTDARGVVTDRVVDPLDRVSSVTFGSAPGAASSPAISYTYDDPGVPFSLGRLTAITRDGLAVPYAYDRYGRPTQDGELTYGYDVNGNRTTIGYPGGVTATYGYDFADRPSSLAVTNPPSPAQTVVSVVSYKPFGPLKGLTLGNGLVETRTFDQRYSPTGITAGALLNWSYTTDGEGNPTAITDLLIAANSRTFAYQPDQYFLTCAAGPWNPPGAGCSGSPTGQPLLWTYDRIGNRLSETRAGATDAYSYSQNTCPMPPDPDRPCPGDTAILDQILLGGGAGSRQYTFGPAGHLTQVDAGANQIVFTQRRRRPAQPASPGRRPAERGRPRLRRAELPRDTPPLPARSSATASRPGTSAAGPPPPRAELGGGGPGCLAAAPAPKTEPIYSSEGLLYSLRKRASPGGPDTFDHVFTFAGRPVAQLRIDGGTSTWTYLTTDHLGTPVLATNSRGALLWSGGFEPFGADWQAGTPAGAQERGIFLRLPGQWDDDTWQQAALGAGVYYNVLRWYQTAIGRYTRPDPGARGSAAFEGSYLYGISRPTRYTDQLGLFAVGDHCFECLHPYEARDFTSLGARLSLSVKGWCLTRLGEIIDASLRKCINESCDSGEILCTEGGQCKDPGVAGYSSGGAALLHWLRRNDLWPKTRTAYVCSKNSSNYTPWGGAQTVIHEWAHGCGYSADEHDIPGIPRSEPELPE